MSKNLTQLESYTDNKGFSLITYFNNDSKAYESHFSNGRISTIKTKRLHQRNVIFWCQSFDLVAKTDCLTQSEKADL
jgi:hypothetical protein